MSLQEEIIQQLGVKPSIDPQEEIRYSVDFLKRYLKKTSLLENICIRDLRRTRFNSCWTISSISNGRNARRNRRCLLSIYCRSSSLWGTGR